jgi:hypothetical protein
MAPPSEQTPYPRFTFGDVLILETEQSVTKEIRLHVLRDCTGRPIAYHKTLGAAFDDVRERGHETLVLVADDWAALVFLDSEGALIVESEEDSLG